MSGRIYFGEDDKRMVKRAIDNFSISQICNSGQCFRMREVDKNVYSVIAFGQYLEIEQNGNKCIFNCSEEEFEKIWSPYFHLDGDYKTYIEHIDQNDKYLVDAAARGSGIRILRQDLWEMIVSFLISQQNNIVRIRRCIQNIYKTYGEERVNFHGDIYYVFPKPQAFAGLMEDDLKECNLGYRSKYVVRTARSIVQGEVELEKIREMPYEEAKGELLKLSGVGEKVAECICLFALHHLEAFPVDTHINQALQKHYKSGFPKERYEGMEGVMQQYIFYQELTGE